VRAVDDRDGKHGCRVDSGGDVEGAIGDLPTPRHGSPDRDRRVEILLLSERWRRGEYECPSNDEPSSHRSLLRKGRVSYLAAAAGSPITTRCELLWEVGSDKPLVLV
jgi:hypothetical protein